VIPVARVTKAGNLRSGGDSHGATIHLVPNPRLLESPHDLGFALCGEAPAIMWSDWLPRDGKLCPGCSRNALSLGLQTLDDEDLVLRTENLEAGLRSYGYLVTVRAAPGQEEEHCRTLCEALDRVERVLEKVRREHRCRGRSARAIQLLHSRLPEPCWGVNSPSGGTERI